MEVHFLLPSDLDKGGLLFKCKDEHVEHQVPASRDISWHHPGTELQLIEDLVPLWESNHSQVLGCIGHLVKLKVVGK